MFRQKLISKAWTFLLVLLLLVFSALAECPDAVNPAFCYDAAAPQNFDWESGDYSSVNWETLDSSSINYARIDFTRVPLEFAYKVDVGRAIDAGRATEVTQAILEAHLERGTLDKIPLEVLNKDALTLAIKNKFGFSLNKLESGAKFERGVLRASAGSFAVAGKEGWAIDVDENGEINIILPTKVEEGKISTDDTFIITEELDFTTAKGENLKVNLLSFRNGQAYVAAGEEAVVGDYLIPKQMNDVNVYFDPIVEKERNYVVITETSFDLTSTKEGEVIVRVLPGNLLFNMVKRKYVVDDQGKLIPEKYELVADTRDALLLKSTGGDSLSVVSRQAEGKTPLFTHQGKGSTILETGRGMVIEIKKGTITTKPADTLPPLTPEKMGIESHNSVAFELVSTEAPEKLLRISSSNMFAFFSNNKLTVETGWGLEVTNSLAVNGIKGIQDLQAAYPQITFAIEPLSWGFNVPPEYLRVPSDYTDITPNMAQLFYRWLSDKPDIDAYLPKISFNTIDNAAGEYKKIIFGERSLDPLLAASLDTTRNPNPLETLDHEFVHVLDWYMRDSVESKIEQEIKEMSNPKIGQFYPEYPEKVNKILQEIYARWGVPYSLDIPEDVAKNEKFIAEKNAALKGLRQEYLRKPLVLKSLAAYNTLYENRAQPVFEEAKARGIDIDSISAEFPPDLSQRLWKIDEELFQELTRVPLDEATFEIIRGKVLTEQTKKIFHSLAFEEIVHLADEKGITYGGDKYSDLFSGAKTETDSKKLLALGGDITSLHEKLLRKGQQDPELTALGLRLAKIVEKETGLFAYSFIQVGPPRPLEELSTYSELSPERARKNPAFAQLELDRMYSLTPQAPAWMRQRAEERYYKIVGGKNGPYCANNPCGPCKIYFLTCTPILEQTPSQK